MVDYSIFLDVPLLDKHDEFAMALFFHSLIYLIKE
jgi:hypothetical protein